MPTVRNALQRLIDDTLALSESGYLSCHQDPDWPSPCEVGAPGQWRPVAQSSPLNFDGLANAAEAPIHPDVIEFYQSFWGGHLQANAEEGPLSLIQLWNNDDFDHLIENLVGHLFMKNQSKAPFTIFFANTDPDTDFFLSVHNESGVVLLEEPGKPPHREVAQNLSLFLSRLKATEQPVTNDL